MNAMLLIKRRALLLATLVAARMLVLRLPARATGSGLVLRRSAGVTGARSNRPGPARAGAGSMDELEASRDAVVRITDLVQAWIRCRVVLKRACLCPRSIRGNRSSWRGRIYSRRSLRSDCCVADWRVSPLRR